MFSLDDARIRVTLDSKEAEAEVLRIKAIIDALQIPQGGGGGGGGEKKEKEEKDTGTSISSIIKNAYNLVRNTAESVATISPLIRGYLSELLSHPDGPISAALQVTFNLVVAPKMKNLEDQIITLTALVDSIIPPVGQTLEMMQAASLFGVTIGPAAAMDIYGTFNALDRQENMMRQDIARKSFDQYGKTFYDFANQLGQEYDNDKLANTLVETFKGTFGR